MARKSIYWKSMSSAERETALKSLDAVVTDCDGVLWLGKSVIPGAVEVMNGLKDLKKSIFFLTNNSTKTLTELSEKSKSLGFITDETEAISTAHLTALYLKSINFQKKVYLIGGVAVENELKQVGIECVGRGPDNYEPPKDGSIEIREFNQDSVDKSVGAVVVGYDHYFSYPKLLKACAYLADPCCLFIATNTDERFPLTEEMFIPGTGAFVTAVSVSCGREPIVMGKPSSHASDFILTSRGLDPLKSLMIGDRTDTDVVFGNRAGMKTLLVLTGVSSIDHLRKIEDSGNAEQTPTYYTDHISDILPDIQKLQKN